MDCRRGRYAFLLLAVLLVALPGAGTVRAQATPIPADAGALPRPPGGGMPNIVLIVVDTLRADRLSIYGNSAPTSPNIDRLLASGARFTNARTVEPLTGPAAATMLTSLYPHEHGSSRNGIPIREGLRSLPGMLTRLGYVTVAFVSNWTLADRLSGLATHFDVYQEVLTEKRWLFWFGESDAEDVRAAAVGWLEDVGTYENQPLFMWVHFVEPHAPYELQAVFAPRLGLDARSPATAMQRYDTEIAAADDAIGNLLRDLGQYMNLEDTLFIFASDHGEGLGEHGYKGHGRQLFEEELRIPLGFAWPTRIPPATLAAPASLIDLAPTVMGLLGAPTPPEWRGYDWSDELLTGTDGPPDRLTYFQAHKGVAKRASGNVEVANNKRRRGLLKLGYVAGGDKQILDVENGERRAYTLPPPGSDGPLGYAGIESTSEPAPEGALPAPLQEWRAEVEKGLAERDRSPPPRLSDEALEKLRSLGYTN